MTKQKWIGLAALLVLFSSATFFGYRRWGPQRSSAREEILSLLPADASAVFFADFGELHPAPLLAQLYAWTPKPQADIEYAQFVKDTGFDYEHDLNRIAIAIKSRGQNST